jgi:hypothetical protein
MSKFLKIVGENLASIDNPQAIFYLKLVDDKGNDIGYEPIQLRGTTYAEDVFLKIKNAISEGSDINSTPEEDNEIYAGAEALSDMGDRDTTARLKRLKDTARIKRPIINATITKLADSLSKVQ